jgi:hypothetical protein
LILILNRGGSFDDDLQSIEFLLFSHPAKPKQCGPFWCIEGI